MSDIWTKKVTTYIWRREAPRNLSKKHRKTVINKCDFEIQCEFGPLGSRRLKRQGLEGDRFEFWVNPNTTYWEPTIHSVKGNLGLISDRFDDAGFPFIEIHYDAKEKKLFFV